MAVVLGGCVTRPLAYLNASTNKPLPGPCTEQAPALSGQRGRATLDIDSNRGDPSVLVIMALSGGGSRSAYLSAKIMLKLEEAFADINLLEQVDAISSVSGGSLPAAYYAVSDSPGKPVLNGRRWDKATVNDLMTRNYTLKWFGNWFWPDNIARYWFTGFDRTDIMARTLAKNLYPKGVLGRELRMSDLNPSRPYLVLNATNSTAGQAYDNSFTFTNNDFEPIRSDIESYSLARAVMGSATFPAVFNYMTLRDYRPCGERDADRRFIHIFDGGNSDNLGLTNIRVMLERLRASQHLPDKVIVISVDAYSGNSGVSSTKPDARRGFDFVIDTNFVSATDALLTANRKQLLSGFEEYFGIALKDHLNQSVYYHISFDDIADPQLQGALQAIPTDFRISKADASLIDQAVDRLMTTDNGCLAAFRDVVLSGSHHLTSPICTYRH